METRAHHILIGLFAVVIVTAGVLFGLWLGKTGNDNAFNDYDIIFEEAVQGLSQGSMVQFNGIRVGDVVRLRLDPEDPRRVLARIRVASDTPVRTTTRARLAMAGVTGISTIQLSSGDAPGEPLVAKTEGGVGVIIADPSPLSRLLAGGEDMVVNINQLVLQARDLFSPDNVAVFGRTLANLEQLTSAIYGERDNLDQMLKEIAAASRQANLALAEAGKVLGSVNRLVADQGQASLESTRVAMAALERTLMNVDALVTENRGELDSGLQSLSELGPAVRELRSTLSTVRSFVRRIESDPAGFLLGDDNAMEFRP